MFNVGSVIIRWRLEIICFLNVALVPEFGISVWQDVGLIFLWFWMILSSKDAVPGFTSP
jgi:hypothetical protein